MDMLNSMPDICCTYMIKFRHWSAGLYHVGIKSNPDDAVMDPSTHGSAVASAFIMSFSRKSFSNWSSTEAEDDDKSSPPSFAWDAKPRRPLMLLGKLWKDADPRTTLCCCWRRPNCTSLDPNGVTVVALNLALEVENPHAAELFCNLLSTFLSPCWLWSCGRAKTEKYEETCEGKFLPAVPAVALEAAAETERATGLACCCNLDAARNIILGCNGCPQTRTNITCTL